VKAIIKQSEDTELALSHLQMLYTDAPHFSSLLYAYGKTIIRSEQLRHLLPAGISALQEV
jgi:hypothetical protein